MSSWAFWVTGWYGQVVIANQLTAVTYLDLLVNTLPALLEIVAVNDRIDMWLIDDGTPSH